MTEGKGEEPDDVRVDFGVDTEAMSHVKRRCCHVEKSSCGDQPPCGRINEIQPTNLKRCNCP